MSFFDSEVVRAEMTEISELQEEVYKNVFEFPRMSLSDDPAAKEMKQRMNDSAAMMGLPPNVDMNVIFKNMSSLLETMRKQIDITGTDL